MIDYASIATDALAAIREAGTTGVLARFSATHDPVVGGTSSVTASKGDIDMVNLPARSSDLPDQMDQRLLAGLAVGKIRKFLIAAEGGPFEPIPTDVISFGGLYWTILGCKTLAPAGVALIHTAIVEKTTLSADQVTALAA